MAHGSAGAAAAGGLAYGSIENATEVAGGAWVDAWVGAVPNELNEEPKEYPAGA